MTDRIVMIETGGATVIDDPAKIRAMRLLSLRSGLRLEIAGMSRHGKSCYAIIKEQFGFTGNKRKVLEQFERYLIAEKILIPK